MQQPLMTKDYYQEALQWITDHFKDKDVFKRYLEVLFSQQSELLQEINNLLVNRSLSTAKGAQLDIIGNIVGQPRVQAQAALYSFFGFLEDVTAQTFGDLNNPATGGFWYSRGQPTGGNITLDDDTYRRMIRARILKNSSQATTDDFLLFMDWVFGDGTVGSSPVYIKELSSVIWFGFEGYPNIEGYGDGVSGYGGLFWDGIAPAVAGGPTVEVHFTRELTLLEIWMLHAQIPDKNGNLAPFMLKPLGVQLIFYDVNGAVINPV